MRNSLLASSAMTILIAAVLSACDATSAERSESSESASTHYGGFGTTGAPNQGDDAVGDTTGAGENSSGAGASGGGTPSSGGTSSGGTSSGGTSSGGTSSGGTSSSGALPTPAPDPISYTPVLDHPRLLVRTADLDRLRSWARPSNAIYASVRQLADQAKARMDSGAPAREDSGGPTGTALASETFAELFAFMSLIAPEAERLDWATRSRTMLMSVMNEAVKGPLANAKFRDPAFSIDDRSRWNGTGFALTVDWIYGYLSPADKATIRTVFLRWSKEITVASTTTSNHPVPVGVINSPALTADKDKVRWAANNYYAAHIRNLGLMALSFDESDDPSGELLGYLKSCAGAWLYVSDALMRTDMAGGLGAEGFEYSPQSLGYVAELLAAMYTSGRADPALLGDQVTFSNPFWDAVGPAYVHSLSPRTTGAGVNEIYTLASYGDLPDSEAGGMIGVFGALGVHDYLANNTQRLGLARWIEAYVPRGGRGELPYRARATDSYIDAILHFLLFDPDATIADPRASFPKAHVAQGLGRVLARTDWGVDASWFTHKLSWNLIDHQQADGNMFELYRKGEWLTRGRAGYGIEIGLSDYKNTLTIESDVPFHNSGYRATAYQRGSQYPFVSTGDPVTLARSIEPSGKYVYVSGDSTSLYNSQYESSTDVVHASRSLVWVAPDYVVTYDRAVTKKSARFKRYWVNLTSAGTVNGSLVTATTPKGQKLFVRSLLPEGAALTVSAVEPLRDQAETNDPITHRLKVEPAGGPASVRFLHLLQGADAAGVAEPASLARSTNASFEGVATSRFVVMFPVDVSVMSSSASVSYTVTNASGLSHLITGLTPSTGYTVNVAASTVTITPGGSQMTDSGGVLLIGAL